MINFKLDNEEDVSLICRLLEFLLEKKGVAPEKVEQTEGIINKLKTQELDIPANIEEVERLQKLISDLDNKVEGVKVSLGDDWNKAIRQILFWLSKVDKNEDALIKAIRDLYRLMRDLKEGQDAFELKYNFILQRLDEIEEKGIDKEEPTETVIDEPMPINGQTGTSETEDEPIEEQVEETKEETINEPEETAEPEEPQKDESLTKEPEFAEEPKEAEETTNELKKVQEVEPQKTTTADPIVPEEPENEEQQEHKIESRTEVILP